MRRKWKFTNLISHSKYLFFESIFWPFMRHPTRLEKIEDAVLEKVPGQNRRRLKRQIGTRDLNARNVELKHKTIDWSMPVNPKAFGSTASISIGCSQTDPDLILCIEASPPFHFCLQRLDAFALSSLNHSLFKSCLSVSGYRKSFLTAGREVATASARPNSSATDDSH